MKKIFITGASGFVGSHLVKECIKRNIEYVAGTRKVYGDLLTQNNWRSLLEGCDVVVHLAARVHVMEEKDSDPLTAFRRMNVEATLNLAQAAKESNVKRFIFVSSIKVNGEETKDEPFKADDVPMPKDPYGVSKMEAENELMKLHEAGVFEIVIIRPPLVYGPGVKANFEKLFWLVKKDLPIPFGKVSNKRSLVSVFNLIDLIIVCCDHPKAAGQKFLVSDEQYYSLKDLILEMSKIHKKYPQLLPIPVGLMKFTATLLGKKSYADRLFGNLHVDITKTKNILAWQPPYTFQRTYTEKN